MNIWTDFAVSYDSVIPEMTCYQRMESKILKHLLGYRTIVDAGCGTGLISYNLIKQGHIVYGFDNNEGMLSRAYLRRTNLEEKLQNSWHITSGDVTTFPREIPTGADGLVLNNVLFFIENPNKVFEQTARYLRPGGIAILTGPRHKPRNEFVYESIINDWQELGKYTNGLAKAFEHHKSLSRRLATQEMKTFFQPQDLVAAMKPFGFGEVLEASSDDYYGENFFVAIRKV